MSRAVWFVAGAAAGTYAAVRARRALETLTPDGLRDRAAGLSLGAQLFAAEVREGMAEKETELRERLRLVEGGGARELGPALRDAPSSLGGSSGSDRGAPSSLGGSSGSDGDAPSSLGGSSGSEGDGSSSRGAAGARASGGRGDGLASGSASHDDHQEDR